MLAVQRFSPTSAIDTAFRIYREHFKPLFLVSLVVGMPTVLVDLVSQTWFFRHRDALSNPGQGFDALLPIFGTAAAFWLLSMSVVFVASMFGIAATTHLASCAALGKPLDLGEALAIAWKRFLPLLGASLLTAMAMSVGFLFLIVPGIILALGLAFVAPVIVLEQKTSTDAISRSWALTRGKRWNILGVWLLYVLILSSTLGVVAVVTTLIEFFQDTLLGTLIGALAKQALAVLATPVSYVATVLLYYDARVTHEAFDVQMLAQTTDAQG